MALGTQTSLRVGGYCVITLTASLETDSSVTTLTPSYSTSSSSQPVADRGYNLQCGSREVQTHDDEDSTDSNSELGDRRNEQLYTGDDENTCDTEQKECPDHVEKRVLHGISNESKEGSLVDSGSNTTTALQCGPAVVRLVAPSAL